MPQLHVVSIQTSNERGGGEYANVDLLEALQERGHRTHLVTNLPELADGTGVPVTKIELGPKLSKATVRRTALRFPQLTARTVRVLRGLARANGPIDALMLHYKKEQLMTPVLGRQARRVVWFEWGPLPFDFRTGLPLRAYGLAGRGISHCACVSEGTRRTIVDGGIDAAKTSVIPNLVDVDTLRFSTEARARYRADWGVGDDTFVIGCISRFQRKKRNDVVIDAMARLPAGRPTLLVLAGDGDEEPGLRRRAAELGANVRFIPTPRGYVEQVLSGCDAQVFAPSPTEGAPRSVILGQLVERPVIATDGEGVRDMIAPGTGAICEPSHDPDAVAAMFAAYRDDAGRCAREGRAGRALAEKRYDPERTLERVEAILAGGPDPGALA